MQLQLLKLPQDDARKERVLRAISRLASNDDMRLLREEWLQENLSMADVVLRHMPTSSDELPLYQGLAQVLEDLLASFRGVDETLRVHMQKGRTGQPPRP